MALVACWLGEVVWLRLRNARRRRDGSLRPSQRHRGRRFKSLAEGAKLSYDAEAGDKGPKAASARALA
jgi:hypothetical protein